MTSRATSVNERPKEDDEVRDTPSAPSAQRKVVLARLFRIGFAFLRIRFITSWAACAISVSFRHLARAGTLDVAIATSQTAKQGVTARSMAGTQDEGIDGLIGFHSSFSARYCLSRALSTPDASTGCLA